MNCHREQVFRVKHRIKQYSNQASPPHSLSLSSLQSTSYCKCSFASHVRPHNHPNGQYIESFFVPVKSMPCNSFTLDKQSAGQFFHAGGGWKTYATAATVSVPVPVPLHLLKKIWPWFHNSCNQTISRKWTQRDLRHFLKSTLFFLGTINQFT